MEANRATSIQQTCELVSVGDLIGASQLLANEYPFTPVQGNNRKHTKPGNHSLRQGWLHRPLSWRVACFSSSALASVALPSGGFSVSQKLENVGLSSRVLGTLSYRGPYCSGSSWRRGCWGKLGILFHAHQQHQIQLIPWAASVAATPSRVAHRVGRALSWFARQVAGDQAVLQDPYIKRWHNAVRHIRA